MRSWMMADPIYVRVAVHQPICRRRDDTDDYSTDDETARGVQALSLLAIPRGRPPTRPRPGDIGRRE